MAATGHGSRPLGRRPAQDPGRRGDAPALESRPCRDYVRPSCVSEEDAGSQTGERPDAYWLIDPIDGTRSFVEGSSPGFVTQVALMRHGVPVEAAVFCPPLDLLYTARRGAGAALNGSRLSLDQTPGLAKLIDNYPQPREIAAAVVEAFGIPDYIKPGSIGLKICRIADGTADLFVKDVVVRDWDVAPGPAHTTGGRRRADRIERTGFFIWGRIRQARIDCDAHAPRRGPAQCLGDASAHEER